MSAARTGHPPSPNESARFAPRRRRAEPGTETPLEKLLPGAHGVPSRAQSLTPSCSATHTHPPSNLGAEAPRSLCPDPSQMRRGARPRLGGSYSPALRPEETGLICKADDSRKGQSTSACTHCAPPVRMCTAGDEGAVRMVTRTFRRCWAGHGTATRLSQHLCEPQEGPFRFHRLRFCSPSTRLGTESYPWAKCGWKLGIRFRRA